MITYRSDGSRYVDGTRVEAVNREVITSSNGWTKYTVVQWEDGGFSCDCAGYVNRFAKNPNVRCKHIKLCAVGMIQRAANPVALPSRRRIYLEETGA